LLELPVGGLKARSLIVSELKTAAHQIAGALPESIFELLPSRAWLLKWIGSLRLRV